MNMKINIFNVVYMCELCEIGIHKCTQHTLNDDLLYTELILPRTFQQLYFTAV